MNKKIVIKTRDKQLEVPVNRNFVMRRLYSPHAYAFDNISNVFNSLVKKYKNVPLTKYKMTKEDIEKVKENPDAILDIPKVTVKGFDDKIGLGLDKKIRDEFYNSFCMAEDRIVEFINSTNNIYFAEIKYSL